MFQRMPLLRQSARLAVCVPFALLLGACSDDAEPTDPGLGGNSGSGAGGSSGNNGSNGGSSGNNGGGASGNGNGATGGGGSAGSGGAGGTGVPDTGSPTVVSSSPEDAATGQSAGVVLSVVFNEAMRPLSFTDTSFSLKQAAVVVPGAVTYFNREANFVPTNALELDTTYTATLTTAVEDLAGNPLAATHTWSFQTDDTPALGPPVVLLGAAGKYAILAKSAVSNVPTSVITGHLGLSPAAASYVTGFGLTRAGTEWTSPQVVGGIFAADNDPPTPSDLTTAVSNMEAAYTDAAGRTTPDFTNHGTGAIGGLTLVPGLYNWTTTVTIPTDVTIAGGANDVWIFQITGDLTLSAAKSVILSGGAQAKNIFWQVAGGVELATDSHTEGIILSQTTIVLETGASLNGRLLAQTAVNVAGATVTEPSR
jgi:Ice-binding-like/Bacterial Ig-like domain